MNPFERQYKCSICGKIIIEDWTEVGGTTTNNRIQHLIGHFYTPIKQEN